MATLAEVRAKLLAAQQKGNNNQNRQSSGDNASYPFWNMAVGNQATLRFLPDGNPDNTYFWEKREVIKLPFEGVVGGDYPTNKQVTVTVPCVDMFGMTCPIIAGTKHLWKGSEEEKQLARIYWKKKSFIYQGFVVASPFEEENAPENIIRRFVINPTIHEIIEKSLVDPDMEDMPTDYDGGLDFRIAKTQKGEWANYSSSSWARRPRSLNETERGAIEKNGLFKLNEFLGRKPDQDEVDAIKAMFEASLAGEPFDMASFGQYYKPYGARGDDAPAGGGAAAAPAPRPAPAPAPKAAAAPAPAPAADEADASESVNESAAPAGAKPNPQDILERIRLRTQK